MNIEKLIKKVGLWENRDKKVKHYSTGMRQRLALAQALLRDPSILILDEPFNGLDPNGSFELTQLIKELNSEGKTILISSHLLNDLEDLADRFLLMHQGKIALDVDLKKLKRSPKKVVFTLDHQLNDEGYELLNNFGVQEKREKEITIEIAPDKLVEVIGKLVASGNTPVNIDTRTILQQKYLEITR